MTGKKVSFGTTPIANQPRPAAPVQADQAKIDQWIEHRAGIEPNKRLTIDVPKSLHARIKAQCAMRGVKMNEEVRELLEKHFPKEG